MSFARIAAASVLSAAAGFAAGVTLLIGGVAAYAAVVTYVFPGDVSGATPAFWLTAIILALAMPLAAGSSQWVARHTRGFPALALTLAGVPIAFAYLNSMIVLAFMAQCPHGDLYAHAFGLCR